MKVLFVVPVVHGGSFFWSVCNVMMLLMFNVMIDCLMLAVKIFSGKEGDRNASLAEDRPA